MNELSVHSAIFETWPSFRRGLVVARNVNNREIDPQLVAALNTACDQASANPVDLKTDERVVAWDEAHRAFNSNPNRFPPAHKALQKRVQKPGVVVPPISAIIAIMNCNSIADVIPVGGDDLASIQPKAELTLATGDEIFVPLGQPDDIEHPEAGEVIYWHPQSKQLMCRRWNWRNAHTTRITEDTASIVMNVDGIGSGSETRVIDTRDRIARMMQAYCGAEVSVDLLSPQNPVVHV